jgi:FkbM family methyltransferase
VNTELVDGPWGPIEAFSGDFITTKLQRYGAHQRSDLALLLSLLRPGDHVVDVGAHIGTYTIPMARVVGPEGGVVAVEAVGTHFELLQRNVERNELGGTVQTINALITDGSAAGEMQASPGNTGSAHFVPGGGSSIQAMSLDDVAPPSCKLIKIDAEGMELEVLTSGRTTIERDHPILIFEVGVNNTTTELGDFCHALGYRFLVNLQNRDGHEDTFRAGRLARLSGLAIGPPLPLFDVVAMPPESDRGPADVVPAGTTHLTLLTRRARAELGKRRTARRNRRRGTGSSGQ